jgi:hypothetical protein
MLGSKDRGKDRGGDGKLHCFGVGSDNIIIMSIGIDSDGELTEYLLYLLRVHSHYLVEMREEE